MSTQAQQKTKDRESLKVSLEVFKWIKKYQNEVFEKTGSTPTQSDVVHHLIHAVGVDEKTPSGKAADSSIKVLQSDKYGSNIQEPQPAEVQKLLYVLKRRESKEAKALWNSLDWAYRELGGPEVKPSGTTQAQAQHRREPAGTRPDK